MPRASRRLALAAPKSSRACNRVRVKRTLIILFISRGLYIVVLVALNSDLIVVVIEDLVRVLLTLTRLHARELFGAAKASLRLALGTPL